MWHVAWPPVWDRVHGTRRHLVCFASLSRSARNNMSYASDEEDVCPLVIEMELGNLNACSRGNFYFELCVDLNYCI